MTPQPLLAWELARKDLSLFFADRRGALLCFAVPILLASAFGAVFHRPAGGPAVRLPLLVVAEDDGPLTRRVVADLLACDELEATETDRVSAMKRIADWGSGVAVVLPAGFGRVAALGRPAGAEAPAVGLLHHPSSDVEGRWAEGILTGIVMREAAREALGPLAPSVRIDRPFTVERTAVGGSGPAAVDSYGHSFCGMTLQYLLFWGMDSGLMLLRERRRGVWRRTRTAPVTLATLLTGKALATAAVALLQIAATFGFGRLAFGVTITGSAAGFALLALAAALLSAATGLLVAALGGEEARARSVAILAILILSMLGGLWLPSFLLPEWVRRAALALPTTWAARGFEGVSWQGMGFAAAARCAGVMTAFSAAFLAVALWGFARAETRRLSEGGGS